jgi:hypothetical protein
MKEKIPSMEIKSGGWRIRKRKLHKESSGIII